MFENILGQDAAKAHLERDVRNGTLPGALLFHGSQLTGKLTTALELSRVTQCLEGSGEWGCGCHACEQNRLLEYPYLLLLGKRDFVDEIRAAADALNRTRQLPSRYLFVRAVRKLTRRFDRVLWEDIENRLAPFLPQLEEMEDLLSAILPDAELPKQKKLGKTTEAIIAAAIKIENKMSGDTIPIHQIRKASYWAHTTAQESKKVVIIENADRMQDGSRNALLKILEEPPPETYFILITSRRESILPTLKSRLRQVHFVERSPEVAREILRRVFREENPDYETLRQYFLAWSTNPDTLRSESQRFFASLERREPADFFAHEGGDSPFLRELEDRRVFAAFLTELTGEANRRFKERSVAGDVRTEELRVYESWTASLRRQYILLDSLNLSPRLLADNLFQEMLSAV